MNALKLRLKQMASDPKKHLKRMVKGTLGALVTMLLLVTTSSYESKALFYSLSFALILCIAYAIPGYLGIWLWRMRDVFFRQQ